ncbi:MAG: SDR family oxidoreductase [bacterium]|nr:SDR family oxidoreductase [bacterium]
MKILVTGGAGFIGSHLVDKLIEKGHKVIVIDDLSTGKRENLNEKARFYKIDVCDLKISKIFGREKPEIIFHMAAQINVRKSIEEPMKDAMINILGSLNLLENSKKFNIKKFIFASTGGAIYGEVDIFPTPESYPELPISPYGICKLAIEKYLNYYYKVFGLPFVSLRFANVYGPRQNPKGEAGVIAIFCDKMLSGKQPVIHGDGRQIRDFTYVEDIVKASILAMEKNKTGIFNIGTAKENNINTVFKRIKKLTNSDCEEIHGSAQPGEQRKSCLNYSKAERELGWHPKYSLEKGLGMTVDWFKMH